jgi:hypothetical protein
MVAMLQILAGCHAAAMLELQRACIRGDDSSTAFVNIIKEEVGMRLARGANFVNEAEKPCSENYRPGLRVTATSSTANNTCHRGSFVLAVDDNIVSLSAGDADGLRAGTGRLLRELRMPARFSNGRSITIPSNLLVVHDAAHERWPIRGHQIPQAYLRAVVGGRAAFEQFAKDLAVFGTTRLELSHISSPLPIDTLSQFSAVAKTAGMGVSLWMGVDKLAANRTKMMAAFRSMGQVRRWLLARFRIRSINSSDKPPA